MNQDNSGWRVVMRMIGSVSIGDYVEELCDESRGPCKNLSRVTFGESSLLKLIGNRSFCVNCVCKIHIPDGVELVPCDVVPHYTRVAKLLSRRERNHINRFFLRTVCKYKTLVEKNKQFSTR